MSLISKEEFEIKYRLYSQELMNISYGYTKNKDDSLDVIQNVFSKFFNINKSFKTPNDEKYWLIRVTINETKDFLRKKSRTTNLEEDAIDSLNYNDDNINDLRLKKLSLLVKQLPDKYRKVIILHYYDLLPIKDITNILHISESAIKKRLGRARNMLKEEMEE
jgi:RNA polymerase sigma-70 factor (ECF subfamily)